MWQCPERGNLHFYDALGYEMKIVKKCGNALKGATFISTRVKGGIKRGNDSLWQCPERGNLHFYTPEVEESEAPEGSVAMP